MVKTALRGTTWFETTRLAATIFRAALIAAAVIVAARIVAARFAAFGPKRSASVASEEFKRTMSGCIAA